MYAAEFGMSGKRDGRFAVNEQEACLECESWVVWLCVGCGLWTAACLDAVRLCFDSLPKRNGRDESSWAESLRACRRQFTCMPRTLKLEIVGPPLATWIGQRRERPSLACRALEAKVASSRFSLASR